MASRASAATVVTREGKSRPSPNTTVAAVTADIRVFWPAGAGNLQAALDSLDLAYGKVKKQILEKERDYGADRI